jgi:cell division protein FtsN
MNSQRGGFAIGLIVGLLLGLALALGVALYVTKAPVPFVNKVPQRTAEQDAAEAEKNKNWDPNAPLQGKNAAKASAGSGDTSSPAAPSLGRAPTPAEAAPAIPPAPAARASAPALGAAGRTPAASSAVSTNRGGEPFNYFVQAGAYARQEDAEQQRARLAMLGFEAKLTEREQAGRTVYRVRLGPFSRKGDAETTKDKLGDAGVDSALVQVQK